MTSNRVCRLITTPYEKRFNYRIEASDKEACSAALAQVNDDHAATLTTASGSAFFLCPILLTFLSVVAADLLQPPAVIAPVSPGFPDSGEN